MKYRLSLLKQWLRNNHRTVWRVVTWVLVVLSLLAVAGTMVLFTSNPPFGPSPRSIVLMLVLDTTLLLLLAVTITRHLLRLRERQGGSRLHSRLVTLFSSVAVVPSVVVIIFSVLLLNMGIEEWFSKRVRTALSASLAVAEAYLGEHQKIIQGDVKAMANDLNQNAFDLMGDPQKFANFLRTQLLLRSLSEVTVFDSNQTIIARAGLVADREAPLLLTKTLLDEARKGDLVITTNAERDRVYAIIQLSQFVDAFLYVARPIDPLVLNHTQATKKAAQAYQAADANRSFLQYGVLIVIAVVGLLLLLVAVSVGLRLAGKIVNPIRQLATASLQIQAGEMKTRVAIPKADDEIKDLSLAFNTMMDYIDEQRDVLLAMNEAMQERRHFIETMFQTLSSGVIVLDSKQKIQMMNMPARTFLGCDLLDPVLDITLERLLPEIFPLRSGEHQITLERAGRKRKLLARIAHQKDTGGMVISLDDMTELSQAQRVAAWSDVAKTLAHEIKNPLTPIQLSTERLQRRFNRLDLGDAEKTMLAECTATILRQTDNIIRLVNEFSSFARIPTPQKREENLGALVSEVLALYQNSYPWLTITFLKLDAPVMFSCDAGLMRQLLTNLVKNALESIQERHGNTPQIATLSCFLKHDETGIFLVIEDNGTGFDTVHDLSTFFQPYRTTKAMGTGLGLSIVQKIVDEHGGNIAVSNICDADGQTQGARVVLTFPSQP
jgi:two-component system nitrogen regulation sensor histidine kinase NtrY